MNIIETQKNGCKAEYTDQEIEKMVEAYRIYLKNRIIEWFYTAELRPNQAFRKLIEIVISEFYMPVKVIDDWIRENFDMAFENVKMKIKHGLIEGKPFSSSF